MADISMADIKGYFKILALRELSQKEQTGYDLIHSLETVFGKRPSAGSMYPLLNGFLKEGYVTVRQDGRKKIYAITAKGRNALAAVLREKEALMMKSTELLRLVASFTDKKELKSINKLIDHMKSSSELLLTNIDLWASMKDVMLRLTSRKDYPQKQKRVRKILRETIEKLDRLSKED